MFFNLTVTSNVLSLVFIDIFIIFCSEKVFFKYLSKYAGFSIFWFISVSLIFLSIFLGFSDNKKHIINIKVIIIMAMIIVFIFFFLLFFSSVIFL